MNNLSPSTQISNIEVQALTPSEAAARFKLGIHHNSVLNHDTVIYHATADIANDTPNCQFTGVLTVFFVADKLNGELMVANLGTSYLKVKDDHHNYPEELFTSHIRAYEQALPKFIGAMSDELDIEIHRVPVSSIAFDHNPKLGVTLMYQSTWAIDDLISQT